MIKRELGHTGMKFSAIGLGTWKMEADEHAAIAAIHLGLEAGANHIDTAEMYGSGEVERIVGKAVKGQRSQIHIVSKVLPSNATYSGTITACERSLKNLGMDHMDLYLLHWREEVPLEETIKAFEKLKLAGKIRAYGVSNFNVSDMEEAVRLAGPDKIACNQVLYNLKERAIEADVLPWCHDRGISVVAYSPLSTGELANDPVLNDIAFRNNVTAAQVALNFLVRHKRVFAIPKSSESRRVIENVSAAVLELSPHDIERIDKAFPVRSKASLTMA
jgi:diketogulonate reductase-like aldo/keto reductase